VPIVKKDTDRAAVNEAVDKLTAALKQAGVSVKVRQCVITLRSNYLPAGTWAAGLRALGLWHCMLIAFTSVAS
jgi:hypothetical protein